MNLIGELTLRLSTISKERDGYKIKVEELTSKNSKRNRKRSPNNEGAPNYRSYLERNLLPGALEALNKKLACPVTEPEIYQKVADIILRPSNYFHLFIKTITDDDLAITKEKPDHDEPEKPSEAEDLR